MKILFKSMLSLVLISGLLSTVYAVNTPGNKTIKEGAVVYDLDISGIEDPMAASMLEGATLTIRFSGPYVRTEFDMGMMNTVVIADGDNDEGLTLMNMMGQKYAIKMTASDFAKKDMEKSDYTIDYFDETKEIAGYKCNKAVVTLSDGTQLTMWYTEKIQPQNKNTDYTFKELKGFPLHIEMSMQGMQFNMDATSVTAGPQDKSLFSKEIPDGYQIMDPDQLQKMMGGGGF